jgi:DNA-binding SARP family transcriptional activator
MPIEFRILGPLELSADGRVLPLGSPKQRALLGLLLVHTNETLSRDRLIEELWAETPPATVESALHVYLSRLRRLLDSAGAGGALVREGYGYRLRVEPEELDANRFDRLAGDGSEALAAGRAELAADYLRQALALWRGPALADLQSERFAISAGARLEEERVSALEQRLEADLTLGRHRQLISELETLVAEHPYRERLRAQLMLALYRAGRQAEALGAYREARRTLTDELGLEPSQELKELEQAILRQDPRLTLERSAKLETESEAPLAPTVAVPPPREERKVVSVLFADLVGFTAQAERLDPEDVRTIQDRYWAPVRVEIERHGGMVEKFVGDAVMALFGAPRAHEDDPERAVRAALAIRDWARAEALEVQIAVTTGEALVRLGAQPLAGEGMAAGDVVNTASRLQAAAPVNRILVGERTLRATRHVIDYRERRPVPAKGKAEPIPVWEALQARSRFGADVVHHERTRLVGRERELELVLSTLARVCKEHVPQLVTLVGVPGIGKTRLVYELAQAIGADPGVIVTWRQGRSLPYGDGISFWALAEIVKAQAGIMETDSDERAKQKLARAVQMVLGEEREAEWAERYLRPLVGLAADGATLGDTRIEAFAAWRRFFEALADWRPLVLVFEDLHWADDGLLDFVDALVEWVSGVPLLVVATARPELLERRPAWAGGKPNAFTLSLPPLSEQETARLIAALSEPSSLAAETQSTLLAKAAGNPLYAEQYVRVLGEQGRAEELPMPETVQAVIAARVDALPTSEKSLLQDAAVFGKVFWSGAAASLQAIDRSTAEAHLHALERKEFVQRARRSSVADESEYAFRHVLLRDVAYGQIPRAARAAKHQQAAAWIESLGRPDDLAEVLAHHWLRALDLERAAGRSSDVLAARARVFARRAGDRALALNAFAAATTYFERALELWPGDDRERPRVLFALAEALHRSGAEQRYERLEAARAALLEARDYERAAEAEAMLSEAAWYEGRHDRADEHLRGALALIRERPPSPSKARVLSEVARHLMFGGDFEEAIDFGREALAAVTAHGLDEVRAQALVTLGMARALAGDAGGVADVEEGLAVARASSALAAASRAYNNLGTLASREGDFRRATEYLEQAVRVAERLGDRQQLRFAQANLIRDRFHAGAWDEAMLAADEFLAECEVGRAHQQESRVRRTRAALRHARGDSEGALEDAQRALVQAREAKEPQVLAGALAYCVRLDVELGRLEEAKALAAELVASELRPDPVHRLLSLTIREDFALVAAEVGRVDEVRASLSALRHEGLWDAVVRAIVDCRWTDAADLASAGGSFDSAADMRLRAAQKLLAEGQRPQADEQLQKALDFYRSVGATRRIREAEALLAVAT